MIRTAPRWIAAIAVVLVLGALVPSLHGPFFLVDDAEYVTDNVTLQAVPIAQPWRVFTSRTNPWEYLPVRDLSYRIDMALFGMNPVGYRVHNLILYALCCLAVWFCSTSVQEALRGSADPWITAATTALFAAHPAHVESVVWIAGRKDLLSGLFALLALWWFARNLVRPRRGALAVVCMLFLSAVLSKSSVVTLPVAALLLVLARERLSRRVVTRALCMTAPLFAITAASVGLQILASTTYAADVLSADQIHGLPARALLSLRILGTLGQIAVWPVHLRLVYDVWAPGWLGVGRAIAGILACFVTLAGIRLLFLRRSVAGFGLALAGIFSIPFLQLIPFTTWSFASERFLFLPVFGLGLALASACRRPDARAYVPVLIALVLAGAALTAMRSRAWASLDTLVRNNAALSPGHATAVKLWIHHVLLKQDRFQEARAAAGPVRQDQDREFLLRYIDAQEAFAAGNLSALRERARWLIAHAPEEEFTVRVELANLALAAGLLSEAEAQYRFLLTTHPAEASLRYNLGLSLSRQNRHAEAAHQLRTAIEAGHETGDAWGNLALALRDAGQPNAAEQAFLQALETDPAQWHAAYNLARLRLLRGDRDGARDAARRAYERASARGHDTAPVIQLLGAIDGANGMKGQP